jgi:hypothetical protein
LGSSNELSPYYYHENFNALSDAVSQLYGETFSDSLSWLNVYKSLSLDAQRLFVRLLTRTYPEVRVDSINYTEISDIPSAISELQRVEFITSIASGDAVLRLTTRDELLAWLRAQGVFFKTKRDALEYLNQTKIPIDGLSECLSVVVNKMVEPVNTVQLLFFGNTRQSLVDFILNDTGIRTPPSWPLDASTVLFTTETQLDDHKRLARRLDEWFEKQKQIPDGELANYLVDDALHDRLYHRRAIRHNDRVAREMERRGLSDEALSWYRRSTSAFAWERRVRLLFSQGRYPDAVTVFTQGTHSSDPAQDFRRKFHKKLRAKVPDRMNVRRTDIESSEVIESHLITPRRNTRVEQTVIDVLNERGERAFYVENKFINSLAIVVLWPALSANISGAFFNPFQLAPADLFEDDFIARRSTEYQECVSLLQHPNWREHILARWQALKDNAILMWSPAVLPFDDLASWLDGLSAHQVKAMVEYLLEDLKHRRSGQPDLIVCSKDGKWRFVEVKGPGDTLSDHQRRCINALNKISIHAEVLWVSYCDD